jgi:hypothetical protein
MNKEFANCMGKQQPMAAGAFIMQCIRIKSTRGELHVMLVK